MIEKHFELAHAADRARDPARLRRTASAGAQETD
jgi:hypothetical protein